MKTISLYQFFTLSTLVLLVRSAGLPLENVIDGVSRLDFFVDTKEAHPESSVAQKLLKRADTDDVADLSLENLLTFFTINATLGTPGQEITFQISSGTSDSWIFKKSNPYCSSSTSGNAKRELVKRITSGTASGYGATRTSSVPSYQKTLDCEQFGSFDDSASDSLLVNDSAIFSIEYQDGTFATGQWATDTLTIGDFELEDFQFGLANQTNTDAGVLGLGFEIAESTNRKTYGVNYTYPNFPARLKKDGYIKKIAYSLYLNSFNSSSGSILFGGVDHAKYSGSLVTLPMINQYEEYGIPEIAYISTTVSGVGTDVGGNQTTFSSKKIDASIDPGTTLTYLPSSFIHEIAETLGASYSSFYYSYTLTCPTLAESLSKFIVFDFQGQKISVPLYQLIRYKLGNTCVLGISSSSDGSIILGTSFLRSAYVVMDLEDKEVSIAQVKYTDEEDIEAIESSVPSATRAPNYSNSWSEYEYATTTTDIFPNDASVTDNADVFGYTGGSLEGSLSVRATTTKSTNSYYRSGTSTTRYYTYTPSYVAYDGSTTTSAYYSPRSSAHQLQVFKSFPLVWLGVLSFLSIIGLILV